MISVFCVDQIVNYENMKKHLLLTITTIATFLFACKKEQNTPQSNATFSNNVQKKMTLPGQSSSEIYLVAQPDGSYKATYYGNMAFIDVVRKTTNYLDGEQVYSFDIIDDGQYLSIQTAGPYFTVIRPTFVGAIAPVRQKFTEFSNAYSDFLSQKKNADSSLKQPFLPNLDDYVNGGNGQIIVKGQIVMSHSSPSTMSVISASFIPTPSQAPSTRKLILGFTSDSQGRTYTFSCLGMPNAQGTLYMCEVTNSIGQPIAIQSFYGTYSKYFVNGMQEGFAITATVYFPNGQSSVINALVNGF